MCLEQALQLVVGHTVGSGPWKSLLELQLRPVCLIHWEREAGRGRQARYCVNVAGHALERLRQIQQFVEGSLMRCQQLRHRGARHPMLWVALRVLRPHMHQYYLAVNFS